MNLQARLFVLEKAPRGIKSFRQAVTDDNIGLLKLPLSKGVAVNAKDERGQTPLRFAAWEGHTNMVDLLISKSVEISPLNTSYFFLILLRKISLGFTLLVPINSYKRGIYKGNRYGCQKN